MNVVTQWWNSKKFWAMVAGVLATVCAALGDTISWPDAVKVIVTTIMVYIGAQGVADFGKGAKQ